jgi:hypothetical protein
MKFIKDSVFVMVSILIIGYVSAAPGIWSAPQVHVSNSTNECVRVINYNASDDYSCDNLPELYSHVWVK